MQKTSFTRPAGSSRRRPRHEGLTRTNWAAVDRLSRYRCRGRSSRTRLRVARCRFHLSLGEPRYQVRPGRYNGTRSRLARQRSARLLRTLHRGSRGGWGRRRHSRGCSRLRRRPDNFRFDGEGLPGARENLSGARRCRQRLGRQDGGPRRPGRDWRMAWHVPRRWRRRYRR